MTPARFVFRYVNSMREKSNTQSPINNKHVVLWKERNNYEARKNQQSSRVFDEAQPF